MTYEWTLERVEHLLVMDNSNVHPATMAKHLKTTRRKAVGKLAKLRSGIDAMPELQTSVSRECLYCGRPFEADGRTIRLCGPCKDSQEFSSDTGDFTVSK
tara:strand:- start:680 stop:979 length:300 start_codon:yes stop_codon:yes gene_type:complete